MKTNFFSRKNVGNVGFKKAPLFNLGTQMVPQMSVMSVMSVFSMGRNDDQHFSRKNVGNVDFKRASLFNLGTPDGSLNVGNVGSVGFLEGEKC